MEPVCRACSRVPLYSAASKVRRALEIETRGYWFWIEDDDVESKATYTLMTQLFSLQAANGKIHTPVLTIDAR